MSITIKLPTPLRRFTQQQKTAEVAAGTVAQALQQLVERYPDMSRVLYGEGAELKSFIRVFLNDRDIQSAQGEQTALADGDVLTIFPPIAGA